MKHSVFTLLFVISLILLALSPERAGLAQEVGTAGDLVEGERATVITPVIGYQGRLVEGGTPVTGNRVMTFKLYSSIDWPTPEWQETKTVPVNNGLFQTALGDTMPFEGFMNQISHNMWLEVTVGSTVLPRQQLMGAPYAFSLAPGSWVIDESEFSSAYFQNRGTGIGLSGSGVGGGIEGSSGSGIGISGRSTSGHGIKSFSEGSGLPGASLYAYAYSPSGIALWAHNDSSTSSDATIVASNDGSGALFKGFGGDSGEHEFMVKNNGDVEQVLSADGLVKAGVYFYCGNSSSQIYRSFNNINASTISISNGTETGRCTLNLGFDLSNRYWVVMNGQNSYNNNSSKCFLDVGDGSIMNCHSWTSAGSNINNPIMLLIY